MQVHAADRKGGLVGGAPIAVGTVDLVGMLDSGKDHSGKVPLLEPSGEKAAKPLGKLSCEVFAVRTLTELEEGLEGARAAAEKGGLLTGRGAKTGAAEAGTLSVSLTQLRLARPHARVPSVKIEIDMPGAADDLRSVSAPVSSGRATLRAIETFDISEGTPLREAVTAALASSAKEDNEVQLVAVSPASPLHLTRISAASPQVQLVVSALDAKGKSKELGVATIDLEADLLAKG